MLCIFATLLRLSLPGGGRSGGGSSCSVLVMLTMLKFRSLVSSSGGRIGSRPTSTGMNLTSIGEGLVGRAASGSDEDGSLWLWFPLGWAWRSSCCCCSNRSALTSVLTSVRTTLLRIGAVFLWRWRKTRWSRRKMILFSRRKLCLCFCSSSDSPLPSSICGS